MEYLLYLFSFLLSFGQLQRVSFFNQQINIYLHEIVMVFITGVFLLRLIISGRRVTIGAVEKAGAIFISVLFLSLINNFGKYSFFTNFIGFLYLARLVLYSVFFVVLNYHFSPKKIARAIDIFLILTIIFSFIQYFLYPALGNLYYLGWDPHEGRSFGLFFDTTTSGIIYTILFFHSLFHLDVRKKIMNSNFFKTILLLALIALTYSRITYISLFTGLFFFYLHKINLKKIVIICVSTLAIFLLLPKNGGSSLKLDRGFTIVARLDSWKEAFAVWKTRPLLGVGFNRLSYYKLPSVAATKIANHSDFSFSSSYLTILATSGIVGLTFFLYLLFNFYNLSNHLGKTIFIVVAVASLFDNVILTNFILIIFFLTIRINPFHKSP